MVGNESVRPCGSEGAEGARNTGSGPGGQMADRAVTAGGSSNNADELPGGSSLVVAMVHGDDATRAIEALTSANIRVTRIDTVGGFLRKGSATLLMGVEGEQATQVVTLLRQTCSQRTEVVVPTVMADFTGLVPIAPLELQVGGATIFILPVKHFERL